VSNSKGQVQLGGPLRSSDAHEIMDPASSKQASVHQSYSVKKKQGTEAICNKVG
jgi:hypothetical protein